MAQGEEDKTGRSAHSSAASRLLARRTAKAAAKANKRGTAPIVPGNVARGVLSAKSWYDDRHRALWTWVIGGVVAVGAVFAIDSYMDKGKHQSAELLRTAVATANAPIIAAGEEPPAEDAPEESYPSFQARSLKASERFHQAVAGHVPAAAAAWAKLGEANSLAALGKYGEALPQYEAVANDGGQPAFVRWRALEGAGYALETQQKFADAAKRYEEIGKLPGGAYKLPGDYQRARMHLALSEPQKAAELLQASVKAERAKPPGEGARFPSVVTDAETLLTELSVQLNAPNLRADIPAASAQQPAAGPAASGAQGGTEINEEIIEQLRRQLASGKGQNGLTPEVLDALAKQVEKSKQSKPTKPAESSPK